MNPLTGLNPKQRDAASHLDGPALVLAGPGTGKTTTMVGRYAQLLANGVPPEDILVATFTRKAAEEMRARICQRSGRDLADQYIGTFHAICLRLLGGRRVVKVVTGSPRFAILRAAVPRWDGDYEDLFEYIDQCKDTLVTPEEAANRARSAPAPGREAARDSARAYEAYQHELRAQGLHDFGDLIVRATKRLEASRPDQGNRPTWRYLMVDEYQDINRAQDALISALATGHDNLWVVGDDDQAIYGWRGSDVGYITDFTKRRRSASVYRLTENYRSTPVILTCAASLIERNRMRLDKPLSPTRSGRAPVCFHVSQDEWAEARWVTDSIKKYLDRNPEGDAAILVRTNSQTAVLQGRLDLAGIPYHLQGASGFWTLPPVCAILAGLERWQGRPIGWKAPAYLADPVYRALKSTGDLEARVRRAAEVIERKVPSRMRPEKINEWVTAAQQLADMAASFADAASFLEYASQQHSAGQDSNSEARVTLSTIHKAKGLEWDAVFVCGCEDGILPHSDSEDLAEERRLAFVAVTRAKRYLTLSWAEARNGKPTRRSPFVSEARASLSANEIDDRSSAVGAKRRKPTAAPPRGKEPTTPRTKGGTRRAGAGKSKCVEHPQYGRGAVISIGRDVWHVRFARFGTKEVPSRSVRLVSGPC